ncbi:TPA: hypothetical protein ACLGWB_004291, partial [Salmonella enterica]
MPVTLQELRTSPRRGFCFFWWYIPLVSNHRGG